MAARVDTLTISEPKVKLPEGCSSVGHLMVDCKDFDGFQRQVYVKLSGLSVTKLTVVVPGGPNDLVIVANLMVRGLEEVDLTYNTKGTLEDILWFTDCLPHSVQRLTLRGFPGIAAEALRKAFSPMNRAFQSFQINPAE